MIPFNSHIAVPETVLSRELDGESVILNLETECYLGLDNVGTRMWALLTTEPSIQSAFEKLLAEYDVDPDTLRQDIDRLLSELVQHGLVVVRA